MSTALPAGLNSVKLNWPLVCASELGGMNTRGVAVRETVRMQIAPAALVANRRKTYKSATSGVKVGLRTLVAESFADDPAGWRIWVHRQVTAVCGLVSSWRI